MYTEREGDLTYFSNEGKGKSLILINLIQCYQILLIRAFSIFLLTLLPTQSVSMQLKISLLQQDGGSKFLDKAKPCTTPAFPFLQDTLCVDHGRVQC